ncbi:hypothetical protein BX600DRAFT_520128 [Xylariales sp. PMI_506]|nr:hypothetical protein BX600DRAFT_520128 [Xylariales sp. PMI_506]
MNYSSANMSAETNYTTTRGNPGIAIGATTTGAQAGATGGTVNPSFMAGQNIDVPDATSAIQQNATLAEAGMTSVVDQLAGLGIGDPRINGAQAMAGLVNVPYLAPETQAQVQLAGAMSLPTMVGWGPHGIAIPGANPYFIRGGMMYDGRAVDLAALQPVMQDGNGLQQHMIQIPKDVRNYYAKSQENIIARQQDVPGLENRRSSYSTTESTPATPFYGSTASRDSGARVAVYDRSSAFTTPSPPQITSTGIVSNPKGFSSIIPPIDPDLQAIIGREPAIPIAVPAVFTPRENMKTLEQSLVNHIPGNRNVYIRGLHPTTDDELLLKYTERFGHVETSKAIIDTATGACKGFGFAKFQGIKESEACIRGFFSMGYEVGFARVIDDPFSTYDSLDMLYPSIPYDRCASADDHVMIQIPATAIEQCPCKCDTHTSRFTDFDPWDQESFNSRLKAEGDDSSTNLYISNLPKSITEADLASIFDGYTIMSSKILRDSMGNSRGVGFARFETREVCNEVIDSFTGMSISGAAETLPMQIRYADTQSQKELKRVTAERRQFRTNEYNVGAYGTPLVAKPVGSEASAMARPNNLPPRPFPRGPTFGQFVSKSGKAKLSSVASGDAASSDDGSEGEGATIHVESPLVANGSTRSSPTKKETN